MRARLRRRLSAARMAAALPFDRLRHHLPVVSFLAIGHLLALTLILVVPLYSEGVNTRLLREALRAPQEEPRPRSSLSVRHFTSLHGEAGGEGFVAADEYLNRNLPAVVALPTTPVQTFVYSDKLRMFPADLAGDLGTDPLAWVSFGFDDSLFERIELVEGRLPEDRGEGQAVEVILSQTLVNKIGLRVDDLLVVRGGRDLPDFGVEAVVTGIWQPKTPLSTSWGLQPFAYEEVLVVPRAAYMEDIAPHLGSFAWYSLVWYSHFPPDAITVANTSRVRSGFAELEARTGQLLGGKIDLESPDQFLADFQNRSNTLRTLLFVFSVPTLAIVLVYIVSTSGLFAERQRAEIAVLKGRGTSRTQILGAYFVEGILVDLLPLVLGPLAAFGAAQLIGRTVGFLQFGPANALPLRMTASTLRLSLLVLLATLVLGILPVLFAARQTLISYQQQVVRAARRPLWQRLFLDLFVLIAAGYGYYTLRRQGSLVPVAGAAAGDPFSNPLSLLLPALALFGCSLLLVRVFPLLAEALARLGRRIFGATTLLALRHLARSPQQGASIVLLTTLTLALGSFSASMATTLDKNDTDRIMYATGGRYRVQEQGVLSRREERWTFLPAIEHGQVPGVRAWGRIRVDQARTTVGNAQAAGGKIVALDRSGFHEAGWWRPDLAPDSLGRLMNVLAAEPHALIVSRDFLRASRRSLGDDVVLNVTDGVTPGQDVEFVIRAVVDNFPMVYRKPGEFFYIGNFDYIYTVDEPSGYDVLLELDPGTSPDQVAEQLKQRGFEVQGVVNADTLIQETKARPERVGFVGLLSLGFVAATLLTMLALLLYSLFSFRRRMVQIGVLRAAGLSLVQLVWLLAFELCFLTLTSAVVGTGLGVGAARLFVPYYQLGTTIEARTPPFVVVIAWGEIGRLFLILTTMLLLTLLATTMLLRRLRIHEAIKLGQELG